MKLRITVEGVTYDVDVEVIDSGAPAPPAVAPAAAPTPAPAAPVPVPAAPVPAAVAPAPAAPVPAAAAPAPAAGGGDNEVKHVKSPIAGNVMRIGVKAGDAVEANDTLLVLEAMKMESNVPSPCAGVVQEVCVGPGESVSSGHVLVSLA